MKRILMSMMTVLLAATLCIGMLTGGVYGVNDPSETYQKQRAEHEDDSLSLWFEHSFKKVMTSDITPSGMDTYSVYMAKNEIENAQFVLYSAEQKTGMTAAVTDFTNENGDVLPAELYYQMYVTVDNLAVTSVLGSTSAEDSIIREGEQPDPMVPLDTIGAFQLNAGKSQAFYIRLKSTEATPAGWYSATLNIYNADGEQVKTAQVFAYVWDFVLSEKTALETAIYLDNNDNYKGSYKAFYDYLLENRINAMDIPGGLTADNPYLTDERVGSIRITSNGGGWKRSYMDRNLSDYKTYDDICAELSKMNEWELIKNKFYFYTVDEPLSDEYHDLSGNPNQATIENVFAATQTLRQYWDDPRIVVPYQENTPYPYRTYTGFLDYANAKNIKDSTQALLDSDSITVWCPQIHCFTPSYELDAYGYEGRQTDQIRSVSWAYSGNVLYGQSYFNWERIYGDFYDRILSYQKIKEQQSSNVDLWAYGGSWNKGYTYANHLIENTGLQTKMLFWQLYQNGVTGYLYYGSNNWNEYDYLNNNFADNTVTGNRQRTAWRTNKLTYPAGAIPSHSVYGNGVLFYGPLQGRLNKVDCIGTVRVEQMRDGIEEYQMLTMLEEHKGSDAAQAIVSKVSTNVVNYLSLNNFDTSAWDSSMDEYDIMAAVRLELGSAVEAAVREDTCAHSYNSGTVIEPAGCLTVGKLEKTCTKCGETTVELIPAKHTEGSCYTVETVVSASCTQDGKLRYTCQDCGYVKEETVPAFHNDSSYYRYESRGSGAHSVYCTVCNTEISRDSHLMQTRYTNTCTEDGYVIEGCRYCDYAVQGEAIPAKGHCFVSTGSSEPTCTEEGHTGGVCVRCNYAEEGGTIPALGHDLGASVVVKEATCTEDGYSVRSCSRCDYEEKTVLPATGHSYGADNICEVCGQPKPEEPELKPGDVNGDGRITPADVTYLRLFLAGKLPQGEVLTDAQKKAADVNGDGRTTPADVTYLRLLLAGKLPKN